MSDLAQAIANTDPFALWLGALIGATVLGALAVGWRPPGPE
jgi:hypothetical protein